ncbi:MAG: ferredoxin--NADP reductase [Pseudomonadota bacterium]
MAALHPETVIDVHHWNDKLFSFRTTRGPTLRFESGHFVMIGIPIDGKPCLRAYSIASPSWEEHLEFLSIKVDDGKLTSRLRHLEPGDEVLVGNKPVGTLVIPDLKPGKRLFMFCSGTGLAPFMSICRDLETYEAFEAVYIVHCVRRISDLAYRDYLETELPQHEYLGEIVRGKLHYYPIVTRESFEHHERIPTLIESGTLAKDLGLPQLSPETDRAMICGSMDMLRDTAAALDALGFTVSPSQGEQGDYVIERAFVDQ